MDRKSYFVFWAWLIVIIAAIGLRLLFVQYDVWYDEACSWITAIQSFPKGIMHNLLTLDLQHSPLYFFLLHFWMKIFGDSEVALRSLSLIFGFASVSLVFLVSKKITSRLNAFLAMTLVSVAPLLVFFSVEIRMYPVAILLVLLSMNFLIDYEQKGDKKSLIKLIIANLLLPYTLVGGIFYNVSLMLCYGTYLFKSQRDKFFTYLKGVFVELVLLIPFFALILYYAKMRSLFIIKHEGIFLFGQLVDVIRNFFGLLPVINVYWPSSEFYNITFAFTLFVIVPCSYFIYGFVQGWKNSDSFQKVLYAVFTMVLSAFVLASMCHVYIFTSRYLLYILAPVIILSVIGLSFRLSKCHLKIFTTLFFIVAIVSNLLYSMKVPVYRFQSFKAVRHVANEFRLDNRDIVIMPFGSDAPYYFRDEDAPRVLFFDFHKMVRNPYNDLFYDKFQQELILSGRVNEVIHDAVFSDKGFSENHFNFFRENVNKNVASGRYVMIALYASDATSDVPIEEIRKSMTSIQSLEDNRIHILLGKYLYDIRAYLSYDFDIVFYGPKDKYTYILLKKR